MNFAGSITLRPSTLISVVVDVINSLSRHGFEYYYFLIGHGGNIASVQAACCEIHAQSSLGFAPAKRPALRTHLRNWWTGRRVGEYSTRHFARTEGSHATPSEVSLSYFACPDQVKHIEIVPEIAPAGSFSDAADFKKRYPDGRIGSNPALANVSHG